jgi:hypothetical protein
MGWLRSFWQKAKKPLEIFIVTIVCLLVIALVVVIVRAYIFNVNVPGLRGKNLWDWLQLLIIPAVLALGGYLQRGAQRLSHLPLSFLGREISTMLEPSLRILRRNRE